MRILVADDDAAMRRLVTSILTRAGHEVHEAPDGQAAWELWQREPLRVVISDWMMPGLTGPELTRSIRASGSDEYTYIILVTSRGAQEDVLAGLDAGADDYLTKPFDPAELRARVGIGERILSLEARLKAALAQQKELATHDALTGLLNRRALYESAQAEISRSVREGKPVSLIMLDIDHFKAINDHRGHLVGDQTLRFIADTLNQNRRPYDLIGRWGGEEFLLVLPGAALSEAATAAERLRAALAAAGFIAGDGHEVPVEASFGVTSTSVAGPAATLDTLVQQADEMLYRAKAEGRNRVRLMSAPAAAAA